MEMKKIKDWPVYGSHDINRVLGVGLKWSIGCNTCGSRTKEFDSVLEATTAWDRRACDDFRPDIEDTPF